MYVQKISSIYLTQVSGDFNCDTHISNLFEEIQANFMDDKKEFPDAVHEENDIKFCFKKFIRSSNASV